MSRRLPDLILRTQSDERLLTLAGTGHESAFAVLVERYRRPLVAHARPIVGDARAEDAVQDGLTRTWQALQDGAEIQNVRAWLYRVVHNAALDARRARGYGDGELTDTLPSQADTAATVIEQAETKAMLGALAALPAAQRDAMLMTAVEGRSGEETARMLGVSEGAVHQLVHRARTGLRSGLSAITPWPLVVWAASGGGASAVEAGGAGLFGVTAVKLSIVLAASGAAAGGVTLAAKHGSDNQVSGHAAAADQTATPTRPGTPETSATRGTTSRNAPRDQSQATGSDRGHESPDDRQDDRQHEDSAPAHDDRRSGDGGSGDDRESPTLEATRDTGGSGTSGRTPAPLGSDDHGSSSGGGSSGEGAPSAPEDRSSGSGSSGSGSGSSGTDTTEHVSDASGSGSSGSGSSGSGSSGSDSSGSGSSGGQDDTSHGGSGKTRSVTTTPSDDEPAS